MSQLLNDLTPVSYFITMMPIREMYNCANHHTTHGIEGYKVEKKYTNSRDEAATLPKKETKRGSYLEDYNRIHAKIPGPGVYEYAKNEWPQKPLVKRDKPPKRKTYIDEIMAQCKK